MIPFDKDSFPAMRGMSGMRVSVGYSKILFTCRRQQYADGNFSWMSQLSASICFCFRFHHPKQHIRATVEYANKSSLYC